MCYVQGVSAIRGSNTPKPKTKPYVEREFLNKLGYNSSAHVIATIGRTSSEEYPDPDYGEVMIMDCNKKITLEFSIAKKDRENSQFKIRKLIGILTNYQMALDKHIAAWEKVEAANALKATKTKQPPIRRRRTATEETS